MNEKSDGYNLADEFKDKSPKEAFEKYLKDNNIKITNMTYPSKATEYKALTGANYITVDTTVKGLKTRKISKRHLNFNFISFQVKISGPELKKMIN